MRSLRVHNGQSLKRISLLSRLVNKDDEMIFAEIEKKHRMTEDGREENRVNRG